MIQNRWATICLIFLFGILSGCETLEEDVVQDAASHTEPIYLVAVSDRMASSDYPRRYEQGIDAAIRYFGAVPGVFVYIYDTTGLEVVVQDFCQNESVYGGVHYDECVDYELSYGHIYSDLETAQSSGFMTWASTRQSASSIFFALKDSMGDDSADDTAYYLAHLAIHEYIHIVQASYTDSGDMPYSELFIEGYAQMMGQFLGDQAGFMSFKEEMNNGFAQFDQVDDSSYLNLMNDDFQRISASLRLPFIYAGGAWAMAYLAHSVMPENCPMYCRQGLDALHGYMQNAGGSDHEAIFTRLFPYDSYSEFYSDFYSFIHQLDTASAAVWMDSFYARITH